LFHPGPVKDHSFKEFHMKRVILALVLALGIASVVGCGGSTTTTKK
jgi:hypothetical protein